jgi:hypothetical protein
MVETVDGRPVGYLQTRRKEKDAVFLEDGDGEPHALFRIVPKHVKHYASAFELVDDGATQAFGELRKRVYKVDRKAEWFLHGRDGEQLGMASKQPSRVGPLQRLGIVRMVFPETYELHWGQSIMGTLRKRMNPAMNERFEVDLSMDQRGEIDRRIVVALAFLLQEEDRLVALARD